MLTKLFALNNRRKRQAAPALERFGSPFPLFIGCATDEKFAVHTAVMLTSLDLNGDVADATILVAGFNLTPFSQSMLKAAAGNCNMKFINIASNELQSLCLQKFSDEYPPPVLGRLFIADHIAESNARLVTLDSDMIVNASLRPLLLRDLGEQYLAAIHDPPRVNDLTYFNSGLMLIDVDSYKRFDVAKRCLLWLRTQEVHPHFPDQDALNVIVGHSWHRLARTWNYFCYNSGGFVAEDYDYCRVAHFAGPKPWNDPCHPGRRMYEKYRNILSSRIGTDLAFG